MKKNKFLIRLFEFFVLGLIMGIIEDLVAIKFATNAQITFKTVKIAAIIALPFAIITELIADPIFFNILIEKIKKQTLKRS